jgi:hypothetical protein
VIEAGDQKFHRQLINQSSADYPRGFIMFCDSITTDDTGKRLELSVLSGVVNNSAQKGGYQFKNILLVFPSDQHAHRHARPSFKASLVYCSRCFIAECCLTLSNHLSSSVFFKCSCRQDACMVEFDWF